MPRPLNAIQRNPLLHQLPQRTQLPQERHPFTHRLEHVLDLRFGREAADAKANRAVRALVAAAESPQHVAGFQRGRGARAAGGEGDVFECHEQGLAFDVSKRHVDAAGVEMCWVAVLDGVLEGEEAGEEALGEGGYAGGIVLWGGDVSISRGLRTRRKWNEECRSHNPCADCDHVPAPRFADRTSHG